MTQSPPQGDSVLGDRSGFPLTNELLEHMQAQWFVSESTRVLRPKWS